MFDQIREVTVSVEDARDEDIAHRRPFVVDERLVVSRFVYPGEPMPAPRARLNTVSGTGYHLREYTERKDGLGWSFKRRLRFPGCGLDKSLRFGYRAFFYSGQLFRLRRSDGDNLVKTVLDAGTKIVWADDAQAVEGYYRVYHGCARPRTVVLVYLIEPEDQSP